jgi:RNase H-like domain found in reverse transcriptase
VLGLAGVFRRFVRNFADKVMPLTDLLKAKNRRAEPLELKKLEKESFLEIKKALISPPVSALPKEVQRSFWKLMQARHKSDVFCYKTMDTRMAKSLGNYSRKLSDAEINYSSSDREGLAVFWATKILRHQLVGTEFVIRTDHSSLRWLLPGASGDDNSRITRWRLRLLDLNFRIEHRSRTSNKAADGW